jgi:hypothetical protein
MQHHWGSFINVWDMVPVIVTNATGPSFMDIRHLLLLAASFISIVLLV